MTRKKKTITPKEPKLFEKFWNEYAMKLDRIGAISAWNNLDKDLRREAIDGIQHYREICEALGVWRMWPQGYLNHRRWEDESPIADPSSLSPDPSSLSPGPSSLSPCPSPVGRGKTAADKGLPLQGGTRGADLPDMAIW